jgi:hypothetical protein
MVSEFGKDGRRSRLITWYVFDPDKFRRHEPVWCGTSITKCRDGMPSHVTLLDAAGLEVEAWPETAMADELPSHAPPISAARADHLVVGEMPRAYGEGAREMSDSEELRKRAAWYREIAECTGSPTIWEMRLRTAEKLEAEADRLEYLNPLPSSTKQTLISTRAGCSRRERHADTLGGRGYSRPRRPTRSGRDLS